MKSQLPSKLYKYRAGTAQDFDSLMDGYVWAASLVTLNDPCESIVNLKEFPLREFTEFEMSALRLGGVCSFAQSPLDPRCWAYYGANYSGYCVEYDVELLLERGREGEILLEIQYVDTPPVIDILEYIGTVAMPEREKARRRVAQSVVGTKARGWQHEGEWRLVTPWPGRVAHAPGAVTGVYLGYKMEERAFARLARKLGKRDIPAFKVTPSTVSYELLASRF